MANTLHAQIQALYATTETLQAERDGLAEQLYEAEQERDSLRALLQKMTAKEELPLLERVVLAWSWDSDNLKDLCSRLREAFPTLDDESRPEADAVVRHSCEAWIEEGKMCKHCRETAINTDIRNEVTVDAKHTRWAR